MFLLTGPASNVATIVAIKKVLGSRAMIGYLGGIAAVALLAGFTLNYLIQKFGLKIDISATAHEHVHGVSAAAIGLTLVFSLFVAMSLGRRARAWWEKLHNRS